MKWSIVGSLLIMSLAMHAQPYQGTLLGTWKDSTIVDTLGPDIPYNEIWGVVVDDREYGIIGSILGTHFIDVTDPEKPIEVARVLGAKSDGGIIHRDYHDYQGYLYAVADEGEKSTLQIMDLSHLPDSVPVRYDSKVLIENSHNIFIDSSRHTLYSFCTQTDTSVRLPMAVFDIREPLNPVWISDYNHFDSVFINHVHDGFVRNDTAYLNCGPDGFFIVDFSDKAAPATLASWAPGEYPQSGYNHSGWPTEDGRYYYLADETWGNDLKAVDISMLPDLLAVDTFDAGSIDPNSIPHNPIVACDYLYVAYYYDGLQVYDISDPAKPDRVMYYPTSNAPYQRDFDGAWGVYPFLPSGHILVSDIHEGFFIIEGIDSDCQPTSTANDAVEWAMASVYPNPNRGTFTIRIEPADASDIRRLSVTDTQGRRVYDQPWQAGALERTIYLDVSPGAYVARLEGIGNWRPVRLVVLGDLK